MQSVRPETLTDSELLDYAHLIGPEELPTEWVGEIVKRSFNGWTAVPMNVVDPRQLQLF